MSRLSPGCVERQEPFGRYLWVETGSTTYALQMSRKNPHDGRKSKQQHQLPQMAAPTGTPPRQTRIRTPDGSLSNERPQAFARLSQEERDAMDAAQIPYETSLPHVASAAADRPSDMDTMIEAARGRSSPKVPAPRMRSKSPGRDRAFQNARNRSLPQMASLDTLPPPTLLCGVPAAGTPVPPAANSPIPNAFRSMERGTFKSPALEPSSKASQRWGFS